MSDFYSPFVKAPTGAAYRLHIQVNVASQDVNANTTTLSWATWIEKDRSYAGFYWFTANWNTVIHGTTVMSGSGVGGGSTPSGPWTGWSSWLLGSGQLTVNNNSDGTLPTVPVSGVYNGLNVTYAPGQLLIPSTNITTIPPIPRATKPTATPSPAAIGASMVIGLPAADVTYKHDITWSSGTHSGTIATGVSGNQTWTVPDTSADFPGATKFPIAILVVTKTSGGTVLGQNQITVFSIAPPAPPTLTPHSPDTQFDMRARLVKSDTDGWTARQQLPANALSLVDSASATATCTVTLSKLNSVDFTDYSIVDIDVFNGTGWTFTNHRMVLVRTEDDATDATETGTYTGTEFVDFELGFAYTQVDYKYDGATGDAAPTTPGAMLFAMLTDAQARGWGPRFGFAFDGTKTSLGEPWANTAVNRTISAGTPLSQVLSGLVSDGLVEYRTEYHNNKAWLVLLNPGTGSDYSADTSSPIVNLSLAKLDRAPRRASMETRITAVTVQGDTPASATAPVMATRTQTPYDTDVFGRMEGWVAASGVTDPTALNSIGDNALRDNGVTTEERTFEYQAQDADPQFYPYVVFQTGDWVLRPDDDDAVKDRINQITLAKSADDTLTLTVLTGDRILSGTASLAKRQAAQTGGAIAGGNQTSLGNLDALIPAGPVIDTTTSLGYWNSDGAAKSAVTISWEPVTTSVAGTALGVSLYEVWARPANVNAAWIFETATNDLSATVNGWDVLVDLEFRVRAQSVSGTYGEFSVNDEITTIQPTSVLNGPDMTDLYTDGVGSIYAVWSGNLTGAGGTYGGGTYGGGGYGGTGTAASPPWLAYVVAEISTDGGATYTQVGTSLSAAGAIVINPNAFGDYFVRLRGYDRLGNPGTASLPQEIVTTDPHINPPTPNAPGTISATPGASWDANGILPTAWFDLTWVPPTSDLDGNAITVVGYDLFGFKSGETIERYLTSSNTDGVRYFVGSGETWTFRVKAITDRGGVSSESLATTATANATIAAAPAPTAPVLAQYAGILQIQWAGGGILPQIAYCYASIATSSGGTYTRSGMILHGAGEIDIPGLATGVTYYAKITMVDELGNVSTSVASSGLLLDPITGVTIQTSDVANTGIKMTSGSFTAYDASGDPTFILNASTGEVWIAPYAAVFDLGAPGTVATTGAATTGIEISDDSSSFNTFIHPSGVQIRNNETPLSWWEADASDASLVNFFSPRAVIGTRLKVGDYEYLQESKPTGTRLVIRYKGL